jgi:hypothetical protein
LYNENKISSLSINIIDFKTFINEKKLDFPRTGESQCLRSLSYEENIQEPRMKNPRKFKIIESIIIIDYKKSEKEEDLFDLRVVHRKEEGKMKEN